jgi:outer membrane lipoprotein SlyB
MNAETRTSLHPMLWVAAIAVTVAAVAAVAALTGFIPGWSQAAKPPADIVAAPAVATPPAAMASAPPAKAAVEKSTVAPRKAKHSAVPRPASTPPAAAPVPCHDCGVIESVRTLSKEGEGSGLGAVAGGVVGGALGHNVGRGRGRDLATVAGVVGGAVLGNKIEKSQRAQTYYELTVRFEDGSSRVFTSETEPAWRAGDSVKVVDGVIRSRLD